MTAKNVISILLAICTVILLGNSPSSAQVKAWEDSLVIPTYLVNPPNPMPRFYEGRTHQGVQRHIYPYPMNDGLTRDKQDHTYPIVYVENEFIKIGIMPNMGGRIFSALDKTDNYDFIYRQHVIKPSLIGMTGYWISGSLAWGFPHHHGPNTVKPMDYRIEDNPDGSRTVWIADFDQRHRMRIHIGYTVYPNSSIVEMTIRPMNCTPMVNSFLFWANPSVHVDTTYEVIFPPSVKYVAQHAKREMTTWPVSDRRYNGFDYKGVNINLWKNIGVPSSFFSWDPQEDYFGGYNHGKEAGTVWIGNHYVCPGMKFWAWGNNPGGDKANAGLTDTDGHYIELMAGAYTDNQPDYSWIQPYESKDVQMVWFPVRNLGGFKYANLNGALNLQLTKKGIVQVRVNTTKPWFGVKVVLQTKEKLLFEQVIDIAPDRPFSHDLKVARNIVQNDLRLSLVSSGGEILLSWIPAEHQQSTAEIPQPLEAPPAPDKIKTVEELYLTGLRLNQFYNASLDPYPYYEEALKRDPGDYRVNTQLGILYIQRKMWQEAEEKLRTAVQRITANYTRARDGEGHYYLGLALAAQDKTDQAYDQFYRASWSSAWNTPAYMQLAEIDCQRNDFETALDHVNRAISTDLYNLKALNLEAYALRKSGRYEDAEERAGRIASMDLLDHQSRNELYVLVLAAGQADQAAEMLQDLKNLMRDDVQSYVELATDYMAVGGNQEAIDVLSRLEEKGETYPMVYYIMGYCYHKLGKDEDAARYYQRANQMPSTYCFPSRAEEMDALHHAIQVNPQDARAYYYLGNLLYESQPQHAIEAWEQSRGIDGSFYIVHRNLGVAYEQVQNDIPKAIASMEKAVACNSTDPRLLYELDVLYEKNKISPEKRYALLQANHTTVVQRSETLLREAMVTMQVGKYDDALNILLNNYFPQWEGGREMQEAYLNTYVLRGLHWFDKGDYQKALQDYQSALAYPMERFGRSRIAQFQYLIGTAYEALGDTKKAKAQYQKTLDTNVGDRDQEYVFYHGQALKKLNRADEARKTFEDMLAAARKNSGDDFFRQFEGGRSRDMQMAANHYVAGLALLGLDDAVQAKTELEQALALDPGHVWAKRYLGVIVNN
jgi:tetratricopeptide (TPR) repeat protein